MNQARRSGLSPIRSRTFAIAAAKSFAGPAHRADKHPRCAAQRGNAEPGIIGQRRQPARCCRRQRLDPRVADEVRGVLRAVQAGQARQPRQPPHHAGATAPRSPAVCLCCGSPEPASAREASFRAISPPSASRCSGEQRTGALPGEGKQFVEMGLVESGLFGGGLDLDDAAAARSGRNWSSASAPESSS